MKRFLILLTALLAIAGPASQVRAEMFEASADWEDEERALLALKWSQLFYELNVGFNVTRDNYDSTADFIYLGFGVGYPVNTKNAWRKFLPAQKLPSNEDEAVMLGSMDTKDCYGGKIGLGWIHYFNHAIGIYAQASWGFIGDFSSGSAAAEAGESDSQATKSTFIYNTVPVELGLCVNMWKNLQLQGGVTYMWKEIPLLTLGIGFMFK